LTEKDCLPDFDAICVDDSDCCEPGSQCTWMEGSLYMCLPEDWGSVHLQTKGKDDCFPDYAGPCYDDGDCCDAESGTVCSNFICRPTK